jgi:hypothetical protein
MTQRKSKSKAGRREKSKGKPKPQTLTWRGLKLTLPAEFPEKAYAQYLFDFGLEGPNDSSASMRLFAGMLGDAQVAQVREKLKAASDIPDILEKVFAVYGMTLGESEASQPS